MEGAMADDKTWPRMTRPLWAGLRVMLVLALILQLLLCIPTSYELWAGVLTPERIEADPAALLIPLAGLGGTVIWAFLFLLCIIYTCRITYRLMKNLDALEAPGERMGPAMAVIWYFIPIAGLIMPMRGVKQIWKGTFELASDPGPDDGVIIVWWVLWVLTNITGTWSFRLSMESGGMSEFGPHDIELYNMSIYVGLASSVLGALACWFMIKTFGPLSRAQDEIIRARAPAA
jgi:hypothetical protein